MMPKARAEAKIEALEAENIYLKATLEAIKDRLSSYDSLILYPTYAKQLAAYPLSQRPMVELAMKANFYKSWHEIQQKTRAAMEILQCKDGGRCGGMIEDGENLSLMLSPNPRLFKNPKLLRESFFSFSKGSSEAAQRIGEAEIVGGRAAAEEEMAKSGKPRVSRNKELIRGIGRFSRSKVYHKRGLWAIKAKHGGNFPQHESQPPVPKPEEKPPKFYPAEDVPKPLINKRKHKPTKLRPSITPGTVLIILAGRFKGKRVIFLKQLESGLLLITGPFRLNGVPIRRVNQAYVIATSTKLDVSGVDASKFTDKYFEKEVAKKKKSESEFFEAEKEESKSLPPEKKEDQKTLDAQVVKSVEAVPDLKQYLSSRFSLRPLYWSLKHLPVPVAYSISMF
eukprot:Gb_01604 [translate_table: standard]